MPNRHVGSRTTAVRWAIAFPSYLRHRSPHSGKNGARPPCGVAGAAASLRHRTPLAPPLFGPLRFSRHPRLFCPLL
jgi:hypothetical protein